MRGLSAAAAHAICWSSRSAKRSCHTAAWAGSQRCLSLWRRHKWVRRTQELAGTPRKSRPQARASRPRLLGRAGLCWLDEPGGHPGGGRGVLVPAPRPGWAGERSEREAWELVSSLVPQPLSWELSVGNCSSCKTGGSALWPGSLNYYGKACLCTGDIFQWVPGRLHNSSPRATLGGSSTQIFVQPSSGCRARADAGAASRR